jgi:uncharacterized lipoprotein YddW (UPF0748 family)
VRTYGRAIMIALLAALVGGPAARAAAPAPDSLPATAAPALPAPSPAPAGDSLVARPAPGAPGGIEWLWVVRDALLSREDVPRIVERARAMGVRGLLVQVVGRGDAWYRSDLLPYPEPLATPGRDPLGELLPLAHAAGLEVHAWMNCCLVWSAARPPRDARHVIRAHPEWVARMKDGRPMTRLTPYQLRRLHVEGVFLSAAHPGVRHWVASVAKEIATRYPVDGIHLDYIRQPGVPVGYDPTTRARFALEYGADPLRFDHESAPRRAVLDSLWADFQQAQVTALVREVRDSVEAARPGLLLSAAVLGDTLAAQRRNRQAWTRWLRDGLLDRAYLMCYAPDVQVVLDQMTAVAASCDTRRVVPGIGVFNTPPTAAAAKILGARELGFPAVALYSYDSLWGQPGLWDRLRVLLAPERLEDLK